MNKLFLSFVTTIFMANALYAEISATSTAAAPSSGVISTTLKGASKIKGSFTHISTKSVGYNPKAASLNTINGLGLTYQLEDITFGASIKANYSVVGREQKTSDEATENMKQSDEKANFSDLKLSAGKTIGTIGNSDEIKAKVALYLPTSNASKMDRQITAIGAEIYLPFKLSNGFSTQLALFPIYSLKIGDDKFFNETYGEIRYAFTDKISTYGGLYHDVAGSIGESTGRKAETLAPELGVDISFPEIVDLTFAATQNRNILNPNSNTDETKNVKRRTYAILAPEETSVSVQAVFQF